MRKLSFVVISVAILGVAGILLAQQKYPNLGDAPVVFDNDKVVAQRMDFDPGVWAGEHTHAGNQLVVILSGIEMTYKEGGEERTVKFEPGEVFWIDAVTHDHQVVSGGSSILITLK